MANDYEKAKTAFDNKAFDEASIHVRNLLKEEPSNLKGRILYAEILLKQNRPANAKAELEKALSLGADEKLISQLVEDSSSLSINGQIPLQSTDNKNKTPEQFLANALMSYSDKRWLDAINSFEAYLKIRNNDLSALVLLSKSHYMTTNYQKALNVLEPFSEELSNNAEFAPALVLALTENEKYEQAEAILQKLISTSNDDSYYILLLSKVYEKQGLLPLAYDALLGIDDKTNQFSLQMKMQLTYKMRRYEDSLTFLRSLLQIKKFDKNLRLFEVELLREMSHYTNALLVANKLINDLGLDDDIAVKAQIMKLEVLHLQGNLEERDQGFQVLIKHWENQPNKLIELSKIQSNMQAFVLAQKTLETGLTANPTDENLVFTYISFLLWQNNLSLAEKTVANMKVTNVQNKARLLALKGDIQDRTGKKNEAFNSYNQAIAKSSNDINTLYKLARLGRELSQGDAVTNLIKNLISRHADRVYLLEIMGEHLMEQSVFNDSIYYYSQLLTKPLPTIKRAITLNNIAYSYNKISQYQLAIEHAEQAVQLREDIPTFHDTLGWAYTLSGQYKEALVHLEKAYSMADDSEEIRYHLAYTLDKLGRQDEAKSYIQGLSTTNSETNQLLRKLTP